MFCVVLFADSTFVQMFCIDVESATEDLIQRERSTFFMRVDQAGTL